MSKHEKTTEKIDYPGFDNIEHCFRRRVGFHKSRGNIRINQMEAQALES